MTRLEQLIAVQEEARVIFEKKNLDYGDAFAEYGPVGVLVRMGDKIRRASNISKSGVTFIADEKIRDTLIDLANYAAMAVLLIDERDDVRFEAILRQPVEWEWRLDRDSMQFIAVCVVFNISIHAESWEKLMIEAQDALQDVLSFMLEQDTLHDYLSSRGLTLDSLLDDPTMKVQFKADHVFEEVAHS